MIIFQIIFKIGVDVSASFVYLAKPRASATLCDNDPRGDATACFDLYIKRQGFLSIYAWYQKKTCKIKNWSLKCYVSKRHTYFTVMHISQFCRGKEKKKISALSKHGVSLNLYHLLVVVVYVIVLAVYLGNSATTSLKVLVVAAIIKISRLSTTLVL